MKKIYTLLYCAAAVLALGLTSCGDDPETPAPEPEIEGIGSFSLSDIVTAVSALYDSWSATSEMPVTMTVGGMELNVPEYQYAMCSALVAVAAGSTDDIVVLSPLEAANPDYDTYDRDEIAVTGGPANGEQTEDLVNVATRMLGIMTKGGCVPNQTLFVRDGSPIAFGTTRATVAIARVLAQYAQTGVLASQASAIGKWPVGTIKEFATEFVKILDVWQANVGKIVAEDKHTFENVHYIPTYSTRAGSDNNNGEETVITLNGKSFKMDQVWEIAIRGILDLVTLEGSGVMQEVIGTPVHTPGDGAAMSSILYDASRWERWGSPWYEMEATLNLSATNPVTMDILIPLAAWWYKRANDFGYVGNYQYLNSFGVDGFTGQICSMRMLLIMARFYKTLLDAGIEDGVYTYMKDKTIDPDLYGAAS